MEQLEDTFNYVYSSSISERPQIKIGTLEGLDMKPDYEKLLKNPLLRFSSPYSETPSPVLVELCVYNKGAPLGFAVTTSYMAFSKQWNWNEWVHLPLQFDELPRTAVLAIKVLNYAGIGKTSVIGGTTISLFTKNGMFRQGMFDLRLWAGLEPDPQWPSTTPGLLKKTGDQMEPCIATLTRKYRNGKLPKVEWLDRLAFREIEIINAKQRKDSDCPFLLIEFPKVIIDDKLHSVVYYENSGDVRYSFMSKTRLVKVPDSEILEDNLTERKHHCLARSARSRLSDKDAKPNADVRDLLHKIVYCYPPTYTLNSEEQDVVWKFRFYLNRDKKALTKFLKCINWETRSEVEHALQLLAQWAPMDVEDALELLSSKFSHPEVRRYAIRRLNDASDDDLLLYLLQLVQALKYEPEADKLLLVYTKSLGQLTPGTSITDVNEDNDLETWSLDLAEFLIERSCGNSTLANYLSWYLLIECKNLGSIFNNMYDRVLKKFKRSLATGDDDSLKMCINLEKGNQFIDELVKLMQLVAAEQGNRKKKTEKLQQLLNDPNAFKINFARFEAIPLPLDPNVRIRGVVWQDASLFQSALMPAKLTFLTTSGTPYVAIFKHGDDLRQDQLILQMITLMDKLLRRENLDLKLTPYRVLAVSHRHGLMQYVDSVTVADVLTSEGSIHNFFRKHNPCESGPFGFSADVMDSYIRSCAGYCVITYLLGVGDRHLDNLLLTTSGKLFHIDFGYILGRDPKPMPPPMKLSKEMVEAMGGVSSEHYNEFRKQCYNAYLSLRRHANVILNLFELMVDASVPDIALEPDKAVKKVEDHLQLSLTDEEAIRHFQALLDTSISAVMPALVEQIHKFTQYWRK